MCGHTYKNKVSDQYVSVPVFVVVVVVHELMIFHCSWHVIYVFEPVSVRWMAYPFIVHMLLLSQDLFI